MSIQEVAQELYGLVPEEFTSARNARAAEARAAGDRELAAQVQALRKPTTGAWLVNQLVRRHGTEVQQVLELGAQLRAAQGTLAADELRALDRQRRQLTHAVAQQAAALGRQAGRRVTDQVATEVEETLRSAMVDADAGTALSTGLLTDTFSSTGLEPVDLSRVLALDRSAGAPAAAPDARRAARRSKAPASTGTTRDPDADRRQEQDREREQQRQQQRREAKSALREAESALATARRLSERAAEIAADAERRREELESELEEARRRVEELEAHARDAATAEADAARVQDEAALQEAAAGQDVERLRERLEELEQ